MADSLVHYYQSKLSDLRVIELKQILTQVGGSKKGVKQDLVDRILMLLREDYDLRKDDVAKQIDQTYKKMYVSKSEKTQNVGPKKPEIRCVCGIPSKTAGMIKCEDQSCGVWQHAACVVIPVNPNDGIASAAKPFYCELCRLARSNPFSVALPENVLLHSVKLSSDSDVISKVFTLTSAMKDLLSQPEYDIQAWCMLLNDGVLFRVHWPKHVDLKINGVQVQPTSRSGSWQLGANGRDDAVNIAQFTKVGNNCICFAARDDRPFCLGVRLVRRRTVEQVMELIPRESDGEKLEEAVARVSRCLGGGGDLEVVADFVPVNLRCPMSGLRMKVAGRFKPCVHMGCFDLEVFVEMNMRSKKWQCPVCLKNYCLENLIIDPYFNCIVSRLQNLGQDVNEVEVRPDGSWRIKSSGPLGWHAPDGSLMEVVSNGRELGDAEVVVLIDDSEDEQKEPLVLCDETDDGVTREKDDLLDLLAEEGSNILSGMKDEASVKRGRERSESPFSSFPTKRRRSCYVNKDNAVHDIK